MTPTTTSNASTPSSPRPTPSTRKTPRKPAPRKTAAAPQKKAVKTTQAGPKKQAAQDSAPKKIKRVRDSFAMPRDEYEVLAALKERSAKLGQPSKKSELLRAGLKLLAALNDKAMLAALQALPSTKAGGSQKD